MREMRTSFFALIIAALIFAATSTNIVTAQEKDKEPKNPPASTVDAWRQALPPEAEVETPAAGATTATAQPRVSREEVEANVLALERKWMEALKLRDASALNQIIGDDFTLVSPQLVVADGSRDKYFTHALHDLNLASYDLDKMTVRLYGRVAVVSARLKQSASVAGVDWGGAYLVTDVWVSRDGFWHVVSRHASLSSEKK